MNSSGLAATIVIYADDVQFGHSGEFHQMSELQSKEEGTFNSAQQWLTANSLKINPTKTDLVLIKSKRRKYFFFYKFSTNPFIGRIGKDRAPAKQGLLRWPCPLPSDRAIPGLWQNLESKV